LKSYEYFIGLRYTRSRQRTRFISVISLISVVGIALGMTVLITVLSVMNGFQKEVRTRMLNAVAHVQIAGRNEKLTDWKKVADIARTNAHVQAAAPYVNVQGMLMTGGSQMKGAYLRGILPELEGSVNELTSHMRRGSVDALKPGDFGVVLGDALARALDVNVGGKVILVVPQGQITPAGFLPRIRTLTVVGTFNIGHQEIDAGLALLHIEDAQKLYRLGDDVTGVRLKLDDLFRAREVAFQLASKVPDDAVLSDWTAQNANYFKAVDIEKRMMSLLLFFIIAIAAFNLVSSLFMVVKEKQPDIAILRTLGASPGGVMKIFMTQGIVIGLTGVFFGVVFGVLGALNVAAIVGFVERLFGMRFLDPTIYFITDLPSELRPMDVVVTAVFSFVMSAVATIYPSWRASKVNPAEALRYE
jgi:lipoprotein-releasing system permease protein